MSEITDLTAAVNRLTAQLQGQGTAGGQTPEQIEAKRKAAEKFYKLERETLKSKKELAALDSKYQKEQLDFYRKQAVAIGEGNEGYEEAIGRAKELSDSNQKLERSTKNLNAEFEKGAAEADNLANSFLKLDKEGAKFFQTIGASPRRLAGFVTGLGKAVITGDLFVKTFQKVIGNSINFAFELDRQNAAFKRSTGAGNEYASSIANAGLAFAAYGINVEDAGAAAQDLFSNFRDFTNLSESERTNVIATTATLKQFGVSATTTATILDQATKSLYMNTQEAELLTRQAATLAIDIGKPLTEVAGDLASAGPKLAFYGKQMFDVFAQLERQSKATGLSVDSLLGLVGEKFDTFEGAGQAVGRLNAILGGPYLNSIDMLNASEADRLEMIKEAIEAGGVQFDQLNKFEQKAFASAMGTDVDTLRRSLNELDPEVQLQALQQEELAKRAGDARSIMEKLTDAINSLIISFAPLITSVSEGINKFSDFVQKVNEGKASFMDIEFGVGKLALALGGLGLALKAVGFLFSPFMRLPSLLRRSTGEMSGLASQTGRAAGAAGKFSRFARGGAFGLAAGATGYATAKGVDYFKSKGQTGAAQATSIGGSVATGALTGAAIGSFIPVIGTGIGALVGGAIGGAAGVSSATKIQDGEIKMVQFSNQDTFERVADGVVAAKPDGTLDKAIRESVEKQTAVLVEAIQNAMNVQVQVGDQQLGDVVVKAMNSTRGRNSISPFYEG
tara:strand:- start:7895 stop:10093 length:2199 start_codon:yes stop_codon:yes gene_type:complete